MVSQKLHPMVALEQEKHWTHKLDNIKSTRIQEVSLYTVNAFLILRKKVRHDKLFQILVLDQIWQKDR